MSLKPTTLKNSFNDVFNQYRSPTTGVMLEARQKTAARAEDTECLPVPVEENSLQRQLRPAYGKGEPEPKTIGNHPDFDDLAGTGLARTAPIVTLFMDIESSTRLNLWYRPDEVMLIKNAFLRTAIELIHSFDGHVHRIMGDAVMAFFGRDGQKPEDAVVDAINCGSALWLFVKSTVIPALKLEGYDEDFGMRVGVDYAPAAYWSSHGFPGVDEVSATAFEVDAASKLQGAAGRNQVMLGQRLLEFIDLPAVVTQDKRVIRDGKQTTVPYLMPNHSLEDGSKHNYRQALLNVEEYLRCSPLAEAAAEIIGDRRMQPLQVDMTIHEEPDAPAITEYSPVSLVLPKDHMIRFSLKLPFHPQLPMTVEFRVENHGSQAQAENSGATGDHNKTYELTSYPKSRPIVHWERLAYRGLHYMTITVRDRSKTTVASRRVGVFIE